MDNDAYVQNNSSQPMNGAASGAVPVNSRASASSSAGGLRAPVEPVAAEQQAPVKPPKPAVAKNKTLLIACLASLAGLVIGGVAVFAIMQLLLQPEECQECNCPSARAGLTAGDLNFDFLKLEDDNVNIIYSPLSIENGLALLNAGASGETKEEISKLLGDTDIPRYENVPDQLSLANAVFVKDDFKDDVLLTYVSDVEQSYGAEVIYDGFANGDGVNNWVNQKTFGLINNLGFQPGEDARMALANALAIQLDWKQTFDDDSTRGDTFTQADGTEIEATTMYNKYYSSDASYYMDDEVTIVATELEPVASAELEFVAVMPSGDLGGYIKDLDAAELDSKMANLASADTVKDGVILYIPKFEFDYELGLKDDLVSLGVSQAFDKKKADFANMASKELYVSNAVHKANINFSERGIKAAAVTVMLMDITGTALPGEEPHPIIIHVDRPFLFLIRDKNNGAVWFTGAVYQPNLWANDASEYAPDYYDY